MARSLGLRHGADNGDYFASSPHCECLGTRNHLSIHSMKTRVRPDEEARSGLNRNVIRSSLCQPGSYVGPWCISQKSRRVLPDSSRARNTKRSIGELLRLFLSRLATFSRKLRSGLTEELYANIRRVAGGYPGNCV